MWTPQTVTNQKEAVLKPTSYANSVISQKDRACSVTDTITVELDPHTVSR